jgi:protein-tyrosine-phosphatase
VHPLAKQLMAERGMDLSAHRSKGVEDLPKRQWDYVVTMGCGDRCPTVSARRRVEWAIPDPAGLPPEGARGMRDQIEGLVRGLLKGAAEVS